MSATQKHIIIVEDKADLLANYRATLEKHGYRVTGLASQSQATQFFANELGDLVILDVGLGHDADAGFALCQQLRTRSATLPILMLTARDDEIDVVSPDGESYEVCFSDLLLKYDLDFAVGRTSYEVQAYDFEGIDIGYAAKAKGHKTGRACVDGLVPAAGKDGYTILRIDSPACPCDSFAGHT